MRKPRVGLQRLKVKSKYSGAYFKGFSNNYLTLWKCLESDNIRSLSTRSTESQTCKNSWL